MGESDPAWDMLSGMTGDAWKDMFPDSVAAYQRLNPQPDYDRFAAAVIALRTSGPTRQDATPPWLERRFPR